MRRIAACLCAVALCFGLSGCAASEDASKAQSTETVAQEEQVESSASLEGKSLNVYCGAGMTDPFQEIADAFAEETGCTVNVTYANAAQIQTQINTTESGDYFIAGSADEVTPVKDFVDTQIDLVKHIPVIVVPDDNPKDITSLADIANADRVLIGDPEATPIGKIAKKALTDAGIWEAVSAKATTTTTAPQISTAVANGEGDVGIVWKENAEVDGVTILDTADMDPYVKTVPSVRLSCAADADACDVFDEFLQSDTAKEIWAKYGYEEV